MKNYIENVIKASFVILAVIAAFAFTTPKNEDEPRFRLVDNEWTLVEGQIGTHYTCIGSSPICTVQLVDNDPELGEVVEDSEMFGIYTPAP
ncbi:DUF6520 family protein [Belliella sp. DSM 111904]|uniref:DUF6520 family protein n=1 Tax=Belliella filtrata TaxID=2923435 RepID=A0ABS9UVD8_9BACT|nr:DUF6520 family protein [Belliella filtrata]MCH7408138.1 DUF6520 family protein [Belliella filtrata]